MKCALSCVLLVGFSALAGAGCGDDDADGSGNAAVRRGVGAACDDDSDCKNDTVCLTEFKGGMCGIADCTASSQCPNGSVCVADPDFARNFCLLVCDAKSDCNVHRPVADEANCSSTLNEIESADGGAGNDPKVCRPPNG
jgi:hypothetical protein